MAIIKEPNQYESSNSSMIVSSSLTNHLRREEDAVRAMEDKVQEFVEEGHKAKTTEKLDEAQEILKEINANIAGTKAMIIELNKNMALLPKLGRSAKVNMILQLLLIFMFLLTIFAVLLFR